MRNPRRSLAVLALTACCAFSIPAQADITFDVDPGTITNGFMNVFFVGGPGYGIAGAGSQSFASGWGTGDLVSSFAGPILTLSPNTIGDPNPFWYLPSGGPGAVGNKIMDANLYGEQGPPGSLNGINVTFQGLVLANTLANGPVDGGGRGWTSVAFIKDFAPDFSSFVQTTVSLTPGTFSITLATINDPLRHVQWGFETIGPDVWITDVGAYGNIQITTIPEPGSLALTGVGALLLGLIRRRRIA